MLRTLLARFVDLKPGEGRAVACAFFYFFSLLSGYYVLRPIREEMGIQGGVRALPWLFSATFVTMLVAVPVYSWVVARFPRRRIVPVVYRFFIANIILFWALFASGVLGDGAPAWALARTFFVWTAVYNLFVVSVFWSVLADLFSSGAAKRLFGFIGAGGTAGAMLGPQLVALLAPWLGPVHLLLVSALFLEAAVWCLKRLFLAVPQDVARERESHLGGSPFEGFTDVARSPYLLAIAGQTIFYACVSTFLYLRHQAIVSAAIEDPVVRTQLFASADFLVNCVALVLQTLATGAILSRLGLFAGLSAVPAIGVIALPGLAIAPTLLGVVAANAFRRGVHFGLERPARETLFTTIPDREKYKAKSFIDTVVYRGADAVSGWAYAGLDWMKLGTPAIFLSAVPLALGGIGLASFLARRHARRSTGDPHRERVETSR